MLKCSIAVTRFRRFCTLPTPKTLETAGGISHLPKRSPVQSPPVNLPNRVWCDDIVHCPTYPLSEPLNSGHVSVSRTRRKKKNVGVNLWQFRRSVHGVHGRFQTLSLKNITVQLSKTRLLMDLTRGIVLRRPGLLNQEKPADLSKDSLLSVIERFLVCPTIMEQDLRVTFWSLTNISFATPRLWAITKAKSYVS